MTEICSGLNGLPKRALESSGAFDRSTMTTRGSRFSHQQRFNAFSSQMRRMAQRRAKTWASQCQRSGNREHSLASGSLPSGGAEAGL
jgi:hypothetical protein